MNKRRQSITFRRKPVDELLVSPADNTNTLRVWAIQEGEAGQPNTETTAFVELRWSTENDECEKVFRKSRHRVTKAISDAIASGFDALVQLASTRRPGTYDNEFETATDEGFSTVVQLVPNSSPPKHIYLLRHSDGGKYVVGDRTQAVHLLQLLDYAINGGV
jgi:hypothetical protein